MKEENEVIEENIIEKKKEDKSDIKKEEGNITKNKKNTKKIVITLIIFIIVLLFVSTIFAIVNINNNNIIKGVYIQGIDVSNLTKEELIEKLNTKTKEILKNEIELVYKEYSTTIVPEQIELTFNFDNAIAQAQKIGKTNNILIDNYDILKTNIFKTNINMEINYNKEILLDMIKNIDPELPGAIKNVSYEIDKNKLIITKGEAGISINQEEMEKLIIENINNQLKDIKNVVNIPVIFEEPENIDIEKIYEEIHKEPKDAYIEENPFKLHIEEQGLDFDISMEEAKEIINKNEKTYTIPLKITEPKVKVEDLGNKIFKETLSKYTTIYDAGNTSRATNIAIAAKTINGTIILPGETFS